MITLLSNHIDNPSGMALPIVVNKHYRLNEFIALLKQANLKSSAVIKFMIIENDEIRYKDVFKIGFHNPDKLLEMVRHNATQMGAGMDVMGTIDRLDGELEFENTTNVVFSNETVDGNSDTIPKIKKKSNVSKILLGSLFAVVCLGGAFVLSGGMEYVNTWLNPPQVVSSNTTEADDDPLKALLEAKDYEKAGVDFPKKRNEIGWHIYKTKDVEALEKWVKLYPSVDNKFDLNFLKGNYSEVVNAKGVTLNDNRQYMLGFAYLKLNKFNEAVTINYVLKNKDLATHIRPQATKNIKAFIAKKDFSQAKTHNSWTYAGLDDLIHKAERMQEVIVKYEKQFAEEKDAAKKAEIEKNLKMWQLQRQQLIK